MTSDIETCRPGNCSPDPTTTKSDGNSAIAAPWRALFFFTTKRSLPILLLGTSTSFIGGIISPATSRVTGEILDVFNQYATGATTPTDFFDRAKTYIIYLVIIAGSAWLIDSLDFAFWMVFGELQAKNSRDKIFRALLKKEMEWYDTQPNGIEALLPRLQAQTRDLQLATAQPLGFLVLALSTITLSLVQACIISWKLTLVTLASAPLIMLLVIWAGRGSQKNLNKQSEQLAIAQKFSTSAFSGIDTVKCFNAQEIEANKYSKPIHRAAHWYYRVAHANALEMALIVLLSIAMFVQGFYYGSFLIRNNSLSVGDVITTFLSTVNAFISLSAILPQMIVLEKGRAAGAALHAILDTRPGRPGKRTGSSCEVPEVCRGDIYFKNVSFAYPSRPQQPVLNNVSMYIPSGDMVFVVGWSGSGKSTLGQLLVKFYSANSGMISIDGRAIDALNTHWLRRNVTLVEQTSHMFNDSVFQNIALGRAGRRKPRRSKVVEAIGFTLLQQVVNDMPQGLDTQLGNRGDALSGGQRQRMALARARLRDTPILILDESTNALDFISRGLMMDAIRQWRRGKTTIIITHDLAQILPDDYVFVMEKGRMVQEGYRKHMEKLGNTIFQAGSPNDHSGAIAHFDTGNQVVGRPLGSPVLSPDNSPPITHGLVNGTVVPNRSSTGADYRKSVLSSAALRLVRDFRRDTLPLVPMPLPPPPPPPPYLESISNPKSRWSEWVAASGLEIAHKYSKSSLSTRSSSHLMQQIVDRAGAVAVEYRAKNSAVIRTHVRPTSEGLAQIAFKPKPPALSDPQASDRLDTQLSLTRIMRTLWPNLDSTQRLALLGGFWACTLHAVASPVFSYVLSKLIATYSQAATNSHLSLVYSMIMLGLAFADSVATYLYRMLLEYAGQGWVDNVRAEAIKRVLDQPRTFFDEEANSVSRLVDSLDRNGEEMRNLLGRFCGMAYIAFILVAVSVIWALCAQWKVTLIMLASGASIGLATKAFAVVSTKWEGLSNSAGEVTSAIFTETSTNIKTVRALTLERHFFEKYTKSTGDALRIGYKRSILSGLFFGLSASVGSFVIALMFYVGAWQVQDGAAATVDNVVQVFLQLMFAVTNLGSILNFIPQISSSKDSASRLLRLAQLPRTSHEHRGNVCIETVDDIVFEGLHFSYPSRPEQTVINNLSLRIRQSTCTAIVGGSGSGKSTIANLLVNLYDTTPDGNTRNNEPNPKLPSNQASDIRISNHPLQALSTPNLRSNIALVPQSPTLFPGTIHENISYGLSQSSLSSVVSAAKQAGIHDFIASLPLSYNTIVGPDGGGGGGGVALSGGQMQRLAIARALVREPEVLVLDEATSALDAVSAEKIRRTVRALVGGGGHDGGDRGGRVGKKRRMTVIVITHAREMMEIADRVVVMHEGRVVEEGGFDDMKGIEDGALARLLRGGEWTASREV